MLSISNPIQGGRGEYYVNLAGEDYYKAEEAGGWFGRGAVELGLSGQVRAETFRNLLQGYDPSGMTPWVQNAGKESRQGGWDLTFSAPKDVSVLWALSDDQVKAEIVAAHQKAVEKALTHLEETAGVTRRGKGGRKKEKTKLIFARFEHFTSRSLDPQIHTHVVLVNLSLRDDRTTGAIQSKNAFEGKMRAGRLYRDTLAEDLKARLQLEIIPKEVGFRLPVVPEELSRAFSKRRSAILRSLSERNENGPIAAKNAALRTRKRKEEISKAALFSLWKKVGDEFGFQSPVRAKTAEQEPAKKRPEYSRQESPAPRIEPWDGKRSWNDWNSAADSSDKGGTEPGRDASGKTRASFIRIESRFLFPDAPLWSPASKVKFPRVVIGYPPEKVWGKVRSKRDLVFADLIVQERKLFPGAPKWSPASKLKLPVLRVKPKAPIEKWLPALSSQKPRSSSRGSHSTRQRSAEKTDNKSQSNSQ